MINMLNETEKRLIDEVRDTAGAFRELYRTKRVDGFKEGRNFF